jgi:hypothetical protein
LVPRPDEAASFRRRSKPVEQYRLEQQGNAI